MHQKVYIITGVCGTGKTTIGKKLSEEWNIPFFDADGFHPERNLVKMAGGDPLNDEDRTPWLEQLNELILSELPKGSHILACSALKEKYRNTLTNGVGEDDVEWIHLYGSEVVIMERLARRKDHYMKKNMLVTQLNDYELPNYGLKINVGHSIDSILNQINQKFMKSKSDLGLIGLGVMGTSLARNISNHSYRLSLYNRFVPEKEEKVAEKTIQKYPELIHAKPFEDVSQFVDSLSKPRKIILMVNAGNAVDQVVDQLVPHLDPGDIILDCGNSHFKDTERRIHALKKLNIDFMGVGVSGGEEGALKGPSIMPGGSQEAYQKVEPILCAIAAKNENNTPCCNFIGTGGAGHFVKMVHNGIEYGEMQLIAEYYSLLRFGCGLGPDSIGDVFTSWNDSQSNSFLLTITCDILKHYENDQFLLDEISDNAGSKGTGSWTTIAACELGVAIPTITAALFARFQSADYDVRQKFSKLYSKNIGATNAEMNVLEKSYQICRMINHHQGFNLIQKASEEYGWEIDYSLLSGTWSNGCIIRSHLMSEIEKGFKSGAEHVLSMPSIKNFIQDNMNVLHLMQSILSNTSEAVPCILSSISYFNYLIAARSNANLIQAQRDYFGAHTFKRLDDPSNHSYHSTWKK